MDRSELMNLPNDEFYKEIVIQLVKTANNDDSIKDLLSHLRSSDEGLYLDILNAISSLRDDKINQILIDYERS